MLGIGNILQKDDGIGVHIVNHIAEAGMELPGDVELADGGTAGHDLIPLMQGRDKIIIVDALRADDEPGSVYRFTPEHLSERKGSFSLHDVGIKEVIASLRILGEVPEIEIIGIVPEDIGTLGIGISDSVRESIPKAVREIFDAAAC